ncbi:hypothetical protein [Saccharopolyspora cebuensis]|uniref:Uncharacterized protein n=1 Tax=Saccharopolyspora cebuensis TaxID=418759 RepID=A0ABV4CEF5_9PSEU
MNPESAEGDAVEQAQDEGPVEEEQGPAPEVPLDVDPADLAEQQRVVPDDEEYEHD